MAPRLHQHEAAVARRYEALHRGRSLSGAIARALSTPLGNYLVNTPLYLLPPRINLQAKHRVLEVGCGQGANLRFLATRFAFEQPPLGLDTCAAVLEDGERTRGGAPYTLLRGTASRLPLADESADLVVAAHVVRHLTDEGLLRLFFEAQRVLRPGGLAAIWEFAPTSSRRLNRLNAAVLRRLGGVGQLRSFGRLADFAMEAHYETIERPGLRPFLFPPIPRTGILARKG